MIDSLRHELLNVLHELSEENPELRLGQLILNLAYMTRGLDDGSAWEIEDADLLAFAKQHLENWKARQLATV